MTGGLFFYKLVSKYQNDVTKNCKLTINEIDSNFETLKDADIKEAYLDTENETLVLVCNDGEKIFADLSDVTYNLHVDQEEGENGLNLTFSYATEGEAKDVTIENIVTFDNLDDLLDRIGYRSVVTDETLVGDGTIHNPLGLNQAEKTGMYAPALCLIDMTTGHKLPKTPAKGERYVTKEYINDYGYLYNGDGLAKIAERLEGSKKGWRVPSKEDWDKMLNYIEPCDYKNHGSTRCHVELGKYAGMLLKSACDWEGQEKCSCGQNKPYSDDCDCADSPVVSGEVFDTEASGCTNYDEPEEPNHGCFVGTDKYGMRILPAGAAHPGNKYQPILYDWYGTDALFWTDTPVCEGQDNYVKRFSYNKGGVIQEAECPDNFYSVRLVKDYDGHNYFDAEVIDGIVYETILFPEIGQIWMAANYAQSQGFEYNVEYTKINDEQKVFEREALFINEFNGRYWAKKQLVDGDTVVINKPISHDDQPSSQTICWTDSEGIEHCVEVDEDVQDLNNTEYRVYVDDYCNAYLENTDELVFISTVKALAKIIDNERKEREAADEALSGAIADEQARAEAAEQALSGAIEDEQARAEAAEAALSGAIEDEQARAEAAEAALSGAIEDEQARAEAAEAALSGAIEDEQARAEAAEAALSGAIETEIERAMAAEAALDEKIDAETERAKEREDEIEGMTIDMSLQYTMYASSGMTLTMKNGDELQVGFDGDWGTF